MNAIVRLILRAVASGEITLTPRVLDVLKDLNHDWSDANDPVSGKKSSRHIKAQESKPRQSPIC